MVLGADDEVDRRLGVRADFVVARQRVGLAEHDGGLAVGVHPAVAVAAEVAVLGLLRDEPLQPLVNVAFVLAVAVRLARAEKRQQGQGGGGHAAVGDAGAGASGVAVGRAVEGVEAPTAVGPLVPGEELQAAGHGRLGLGSAARLPHVPRAGLGVAAGEHLARRQLRKRDRHAGGRGGQNADRLGRRRRHVHPRQLDLAVGRLGQADGFQRLLQVDCPGLLEIEGFRQRGVEFALFAWDVLVVTAVASTIRGWGVSRWLNQMPISISATAWNTRLTSQAGVWRRKCRNSDDERGDAASDASSPADRAGPRPPARRATWPCWAMVGKGDLGRAAAVHWRDGRCHPTHDCRTAFPGRRGRPLLTDGQHWRVACHPRGIPPPAASCSEQPQGRLLLLFGQLEARAAPPAVGLPARAGSTSATAVGAGAGQHAAVEPERCRRRRPIAAGNARERLE